MLFVACDYSQKRATQLDLTRFWPCRSGRLPSVLSCSGCLAVAEQVSRSKTAARPERRIAPVAAHGTTACPRIFLGLQPGPSLCYLQHQQPLASLQRRAQILALQVRSALMRGIVTMQWDQVGAKGRRRTWNGCARENWHNFSPSVDSWAMHNSQAHGVPASQKAFTNTAST